MLDERHDGGEQEVLVKWGKWDGPPEWVRLSTQPELAKYLSRNEVNPYSSTLVYNQLSQTPLPHENMEVLALRQAIFDSLGGGNATREGRRGMQAVVSVCVPFSKESFDATFRSLGLDLIPAGEHGNVRCYISCGDLTYALGPGWDFRSSEGTSTRTFVSRAESDPPMLTWSYKRRVNFSHTDCPRY